MPEMSFPMVDAIAHVRFAWSADSSQCRATAYAVNGDVLGEVVVELPLATRQRILAVRGGTARLRLEEAAERHLRTMLDLRY